MLNYVCSALTLYAEHMLSVGPHLHSSVLRACKESGTLRQLGHAVLMGLVDDQLPALWAGVCPGVVQLRACSLRELDVPGANLIVNLCPRCRQQSQWSANTMQERQAMRHGIGSKDVLMFRSISRLTVTYNLYLAGKLAALDV